MLLFEQKQHRQSYDAQSSMQREILYFTELLIDHPFKINISGESGSDDKKCLQKDKSLSIIHG